MSTQKNPFGMANISDVVIASALTFVTWKILQGTIGHKLDAWVERRRPRSTNAAIAEKQRT